MNAARIFVHGHDLRALGGLYLCIVKKVSWLDTDPCDDIMRITSRLAFEHDALFASTDGETLLAVIMARAAGHILTVAAALHALKVL